MKNYSWEYFNVQINQKLSERKAKTIYSQRKIDVESVFGIMKPILSFTRKSVRGINKDKRELGLVLMILNIRKVPAQRAENYKKIIKKPIFKLFHWKWPFFTYPGTFFSGPFFFFE
ncbi:transposase, partial [Staphylococcus epidermidis]|uniref:transposase n=3 Tax=Staphylococcus epidermidis TaxID=1282 RepID=UPI001E442EB8